MSTKPIEAFQFLKPEVKYIFKEENSDNFLGYRGQGIPTLTSYGIKGVKKSEQLYWKYGHSNLNDGAGVNYYIVDLSHIDIDYTGDWKDSLFERPKK